MTTTTCTVIDVQSTDFTGPDGRTAPVWLITYAAEDGSLHAHGFPHETLGWRAAEYGIAAADADTLLGVVLAEPYMTPVDHTHPSFVWNTDAATARTAHLGRVAQVRKQLAIADPQGLLQRIKDAYTASFNPTEHGRRVQAVAAVRRGNHAPHVQLIQNRPLL